MTQETIALVALAVVSVFLLLTVIVLLARRGRADTSSVFLSISKRLDDLTVLTHRFSALEKMFFSSKHRGMIGETLLEELIKSTLPRGTYKFQQTFRDGSRVDAVILLGDKIIPVDAKFPLDVFEPETESKKGHNASRAILQYMKDISSKYIKPGEGTFPYAIMYIPSEAVYYESFVQHQEKTDLFREARKFRVIPAGPSSFFIFLQTIMHGIRSVSINRNIEDYLTVFQQFSQDFSSFSHAFATFGTHLKNTHNSFEEALARFNRLDLSLRRLEGTTEKNFGATEAD